MSQLTTNTTTIDECITLANSLPDAGSGSGGAVETCAVIVKTTVDAGDNGFIPEGVFLVSSSGTLEPLILTEAPVETQAGTGATTTIYTVSNVVKGSIVTLANTGTSWEYGLETSGGVNRLDVDYVMTTAVSFCITGDCQITFSYV